MAKISVLEGRGMASNCYILESCGRYIVVDPSVPLSELYNQRIDLVGTLPQVVLLTHLHYDHIIGLDSYYDAGVEICISEEDGKFLSDPVYNCARFLGAGEYGFFGKYKTLSEGEKIIVGDEVLTVLKTPGHTLGSVCFVGEGFAFTGDTLFEGGGYGRYDLPGGDVSALRLSLMRILNLPEKTVIFPGHGTSSDIGRSKKYF